VRSPLTDLFSLDRSARFSRQVLTFFSAFSPRLGKLKDKLSSCSDLTRLSPIRPGRLLRVLHCSSFASDWFVPPSLLPNGLFFEAILFFFSLTPEILFARLKREWLTICFPGVETASLFLYFFREAL